MVNHNTRCYWCGHEDIRDIKDANDAWRGPCDHCDCSNTVRRIVSAPHLGLRGDAEIAALQNDCRQRYYKTGIDEVRHKHGVAADDAVRGAIAKKVKDATNS